MDLKTYLQNKRPKPLRQEDFASLLGIQQATLSRYMTGDRNVPLEVVEKVHELTNGRVKLADWLAIDPKTTKRLRRPRKMEPVE